MRTDRECAVFVRRGDILLILHRTPPDPYWHTVAGVVDRHETFVEAARRELNEEVGLDAPLADLGLPQTYRVPEEWRDEYEPGVAEVTIRSFAVEAPTGWEPVLNEEHDGYRWVDHKDAMAIVRWPETRQLIAALFASRAGEGPPARA